MTDLSTTVAPKSDQLNADDLIAGPRTITITRVSGNEGNADQPINIFFEGDNGKPFRPCKSMRRVLIQCWGPDGNTFAGRSMTLYRDPKVKFGGLEVGGIRISHMSHIERDMTMAITETKARRSPYTVKQLRGAPGQQGTGIDPDTEARLKADAEAAACQGREAFVRFWNRADVKPLQHVLRADLARYQKLVNDIEAQREAAKDQADPFTPPADDDPTPRLSPEEEARIQREIAEQAERDAEAEG